MVIVSNFQSKYKYDQQKKVTSESKLARRFCHTVVPPSTVTLKVASFHILKRIPDNPPIGPIAAEKFPHVLRKVGFPNGSGPVGSSP